MQGVETQLQNKENIPLGKELNMQKDENTKKYSLQIQLIPPGFTHQDKNKENSSQDGVLQEKKNLNPFANEFRPNSVNPKDLKKLEQVISFENLTVKKVILNEPKVLASIENNMKESNIEVSKIPEKQKKN